MTEAQFYDANVDSSMANDPLARVALVGACIKQGSTRDQVTLVGLTSQNIKLEMTSGEDILFTDARVFEAVVRSYAVDKALKKDTELNRETYFKALIELREQIFNSAEQTLKRLTTAASYFGKRDFLNISKIIKSNKRFKIQSVFKDATAAGKATVYAETDDAEVENGFNVHVIFHEEGQFDDFNMALNIKFDSSKSLMDNHPWAKSYLFEIHDKVDFVYDHQVQH
jgi:hypothetical protein